MKKAWQKLQYWKYLWSWDSDFRHKHYTLISRVVNAWYVVTVLFWTTLVCAVALGILAGVVYLTSQPPCASMAQAFTGQFHYDVINGCFIDVGAGRFLPAKNIMYIVGQGMQIIQ